MKSSPGDNINNTGNVYYSKLILFLFPLQIDVVEYLWKVAPIAGLLGFISILLWNTYRKDKKQYEEALEKERTRYLGLLTESLSVVTKVEEKLGKSDQLVQEVHDLGVKIENMHKELERAINGKAS